MRVSYAFMRMGNFIVVPPCTLEPEPAGGTGVELLDSWSDAAMPSYLTAS
jgi:hypothetical protein